MLKDFIKELEENFDLEGKSHNYLTSSCTVQVTFNVFHIGMVVNNFDT